MADTIQISEITKCTGGAHWTFTGTVNGKERKVSFAIQDVVNDWDDIPLKDRFIFRVYQECLAKGLTTFNQVRTNFIDKAVIC